MSVLPPVIYATSNGHWFARTYEHLDAVAYTRVAGALRRYHDERDAFALANERLREALSTVVEAFVEMPGCSYGEMPNAAIEAARKLLERT